MLNALIILHVISAIVLVLVVLLQSGRGAELGAAFGGLGQATYGNTQPSAITRITAILAVIFMTTSITLAIFYQTKPAESVIDSTPLNPSQQTAP